MTTAPPSPLRAFFILSKTTSHTTSELTTVATYPVPSSEVVVRKKLVKAAIKTKDKSTTVRY